jgi:dTMP kinase
VPDLTVFSGHTRHHGAGAQEEIKWDRFEVEELSFHERVRQGYLEMARAEPGRWLVVDAVKSREEIGSIIWQRLSRMLPG